MATNIHAEAASFGSASTAASFFDALVRCETRLYNALHDRLREEHGIAASQFEFLRYVKNHPRARVADLAQAFAIGVGAASKGVDRLEDKGWVTRTANPEDRRSSLLSLSESGHALVADADTTFGAALTGILTDAGADADLQHATAVLQRLQQFLESRRIGAPIG